MNARIAALVIVMLLPPSLFAETILGGAVSYSPPIPMMGGNETGNAGLPINGTEFRTEGGTNGYAQVNFEIMSVLAIFPRPNQATGAIRSITDLKNSLETIMNARTNLLNVSTSVGKLGGRDAVTCNAEVRGQLCKWSQSTYTFWQVSPQWPRSSLLHVFVVAEKKETFDKLVKSLERATIKPPAK